MRAAGGRSNARPERAAEGSGGGPASLPPPADWGNPNAAYEGFVQLNNRSDGFFDVLDAWELDVDPVAPFQDDRWLFDAGFINARPEGLQRLLNGAVPNVLGLILRQFSQIGTKFLEVQASYLFIQMLWKHIYFVFVVFAIFPKFDLRQNLVRERG